MSEYDYDLFYHALNYRTAATQHAELAWIELERCVNRIVAKAVESERSVKTHQPKQKPE